MLVKLNDRCYVDLDTVIAMRTYNDPSMSNGSCTLLYLNSGAEVKVYMHIDDVIAVFRGDSYVDKESNKNNQAR